MNNAVAEIKDRTGYIGSSDAAAVLGKSRWKTQLQLWGEKTGELVPEDISGKLQVELGIELEDFIARKFTQKTGLQVRKVLDKEGNPKTTYHKKYPFLGATLDREVIVENAALECKTASARKAKEYEDDEIPLEYIIQCHHQIAVCGLDKVYLAVLIGNEDFQVKEILRDETAAKHLIAKEVDFWQKFVVPKIMPITVSKDDGETLENLFTVEEGSVIELGDEADRLVESIQSLTADKKDVEDKIERQKNELKLLLKEKEIGLTSKYKITWKEQSKSTVDIKRLKLELPGIYNKYVQDSKFRVIRYGELKEGRK